MWHAGKDQNCGQVDCAKTYALHEAVKENMKLWPNTRGGQMMRESLWFVLLYALIVCSTSHAQQFEIITVGPQGQNLNQQGQQTSGQIAATPSQQPLQPTSRSPLRPSPSPQSSLVPAETRLSQQREILPEMPSAFEKYVLLKTREAVEQEVAAVRAGRVDEEGVRSAVRAGRVDEEGVRSDDTRLYVRQFGYDLFSQPPSTFAPVEQVPVGPDYVIGPDDEIRISVWGKVEGQWTIRVDRDGNITMPRLGILGVTGLTFKELKDLLSREFSKYYTGYEMNVSMGSLRTIRVYIVGNVSRPGSYTVSSLATLVNAFIEAGGPSKIGTMRDIQLKRNGKTVVHFDMYDLLLKGDKTNDVKIMPEDVIFIPPVGPLAAIIGNVKNPAIYELKGEVRLMDLIHMAGGLTGRAFKGRVQLQRTENRQSRTVFEGDLIDVEKDGEKNFVLRDWDMVRLFDVAEVRNVVRVTGAVASPSEFGITSGTTRVADVIAQSGGLLYYASNTAEVTRVKVTQAGPVTERFTVDLSKALQGDVENNVLLEMNDYLFVRAVPEWQLYRTVTISGEVKYPGIYTIKKGERLSSLIERAGGYTDRAYLRGAVFTRDRVRDLQQRNLQEMTVRLERELLAESSTVRSSSAESVEARRVELQQKQAFIESLRRARATGRLTIVLTHLRLLKGSGYDIELENNDSLLVPLNNNVVNVVGAVMSNASLVYVGGVPLKNYIEMAGGYSKYADAGNTYVLKVDGGARKLSGGFVNWNGSSERWELAGFGGRSTDIEPGDTIVVPEKLERIAWLREIKDITQIFAQLATAAGIIYLVSK